MCRKSERYRQFWPQATAAAFRAFLRGKGLYIPPAPRFVRSRHGTSYWMEWHIDGRRHTAHYTTQHGQPLLLVDEQPLETTRAEMIAAGMGYEADYEI